MITFLEEVYFGLVAGWGSHSRSANGRREGASRNLVEWKPLQLGQHCRAMMGGFLALETERTVLREYFYFAAWT